MAGCSHHDPQAPDVAPTARPIRSVGIVGAGLMGRSIALANVRNHVAVTLTDVSAPALAAAAGKLGAWPSLRVTAAEQELSHADLVLEAIVERSGPKQKLLARLERQLPPHALMASNTSSIPIGQLASVLTRPERFCGL